MRCGDMYTVNVSFQISLHPKTLFTKFFLRSPKIEQLNCQNNFRDSTVWNFWIKVSKVDDKVKNSCGLHKNFDYVRASE